ncbi:MAG: hypothetical protein H6617_04265 [Bdellovibrionaceae bacterium]|nr:hypothetical protein [Bdellovibrionales bacterium]MCB9253874.1 hypothetical protein [Pseudobdellovibrionaceae bacterium]
MIRTCLHLALLLLWLSPIRPLCAEPVYEDDAATGRTRNQIESEEEPPLLPTRRSREKGVRENRSAPRRQQKPLEGNRPRQRPGDRVYRPRIHYDRPVAHPLDTLFMSALLHTPLIRENTYDKRFTSYGADFLASLPIFALGDAYLHGEFGFGFTFSRLSALPLVDSFTHIYFQLPLRLRLLVPLQDESLVLEFLAGMHMRLFEYDSRPTTDGGFHFVTGGLFQNLDPNFGIGLGIRLSETLKLRVVAEFVNLSVGLEF